MSPPLDDEILRRIGHFNANLSQLVRAWNRLAADHQLGDGGRAFDSHLDQLVLAWSRLAADLMGGGIITEP